MPVLLGDALHKLGVSVDEVIPSIRSIEPAMPPINRLPSTISTGAPVPTAEVSDVSVTFIADNPAMSRVVSPRQSVTTHRVRSGSR